MHSEEVERFIFVLFIQMSITFFFINYQCKLNFQFHWMPYRGFESFLPKHAYKDSKIWSAYVALICFPLIVSQQIDRVMLQFGFCQDMSNLSHNLGKFHHIDMRGHNETN